MFLLLLACSGSGDDTGKTTDTSTADPLCADAPIVTFETFGAAFMTENCQSCHASTSANRNGAPAEVVFDAGDGVVDKDVTWSWAERILARATSDPIGMPPMGGTTDDDRYRLTVWLTCNPAGT